jgi:hypothetical protein
MKRVAFGEPNLFTTNFLALVVGQGAHVNGQCDEVAPHFCRPQPHEHPFVARYPEPVPLRHPHHRRRASASCGRSGNPAMVATNTRRLGAERDAGMDNLHGYSVAEPV